MELSYAPLVESKNGPGAFYAEFFSISSDEDEVAVWTAASPGLLLDSFDAGRLVQHSRLPHPIGLLLPFTRFLRQKSGELVLICVGRMAGRLLEQHHAFLYRCERVPQ